MSVLEIYDRIITTYRYYVKQLNVASFMNIGGPVSWGCRIHRLHLCTGVKPLSKCPGYDTKQSDGESPVMMKLWEKQSTPSLP